MTKSFAVFCLVTIMVYGRVVTGQLGCTSALMGLSPCLNYISGSAPTPGSSCCTQLQSVVKTQASCLCQVLNGSGISSFGVTINQTQALQLPNACNVTTPPVSQCNAVNQPSGNPAAAAASPAGSPTSSPADASTKGSGSVTPNAPTMPTVSTTPSTGSGSGSKSTKGNTSNGNMTKFPMYLTLLFLFVITI